LTIAVVAVAALLLAAPARAQEASTLSGVAADEAGRPIAGATVPL
jgi:hypothetical protein